MGHSRVQSLGSAVAVAAVLAAFVLLLAPAAAQAAPVETIAGPGSGAGKVNQPRGTAVDQSNGDLYVADDNNSRIDKFDSEGNFLLAWGFGVADGKSAQLQTCGPQASPPTIRCFGPFFINNFEPGHILPGSVAVDQSSHDVYVVDGNNRRVTKFGPDGEFIFMVGKNVDQGGGSPAHPGNVCTAAYLENGDTCGAGQSGSGPGEFFTSPGAVIVDASSNIWVLDGSRIDQFDSSGSFLSQVPIPAGAAAHALGRDSVGDFYTIREGVNEVQEVSLSSFANGDTFRLGNLPAPCSASSTAPITFDKTLSGLFPISESIEDALRKACGGDDFSVDEISIFTNHRVSFHNRLADQNAALLTCAKLTGAGSCSVVPHWDGVPGTVDKLDPSGAFLKTIYTGAPEALALDSADNLYVGDDRNYHFLKFTPAGELISLFGAGQVSVNRFGEGPTGNALALDEGEGHDYLYAVNGLNTAEGAAVQRFTFPAPGPLPEDVRAEDVLPTSATLAASLNPEGHATEYHFEYVTQQGYEEQEESFVGPHTVITPTETLPGSGFEGEEASANIDHLVPETEYRFRIVATNSKGTVEEEASFTARPAVAVDAQWASEVAAHSAFLHAELNPLGVSGEWWLEYGTSEGYGHATVPVALPASFGDLAVGAVLSGLEPATTYHYRFAAADEREGAEYTVHGEDRTLATQPAGLGFSLADDRAWEMVSPPDKHGGSIKLGYGEGQIQAAADGEATSYLSAGSIEAAPEGNRTLERSSVLSRRDSSGGWSSKDISTPNAAVASDAAGAGFEYRLFSSDLGSALLEPRSSTPLSPDASERTPYLRQNTEPPGYTPLVVGCPSPPEPCPPAVEEHADVPPGTEFGVAPGDNPLIVPNGAVQVEGAAPDLAHVVLKSAVPLVAGAAVHSLYAWTAGRPPAQRLQPVSELPEGGSVVAGELGSQHASVRGAISADGSRVFWSGFKGLDPTHPTPGALYLRDTEREETLRLDAVQPGAFGTGKAFPLFQGADSQGTVAFFTDTQNLTEDANENGADLYRCRVVVEGGELKCDLTDLTAHTANPADPFESAEMQGLAAGVSEDGAHVYFVARGVLSSNAVENGAGVEEARPDQPNLYLWQEGSGVRFIATLAEEDERDWSGFSIDPGELGQPAAEQTAAASPSGRYLAFMTALPLTGYDNRDARTGEADQEVFRYDAEANGGEGGLICASCNPSGARPAGLRGYEGAGGAPFYDFQELWTQDQPLAAVLPDATRLGKGGASSLYRPRAVQDNGRLFFNAADSLVAADSNGTWDVYEYEPTGAGSCTASSGGAGTARSAEGCVSLISSGTGDEEAGLLDASEGGNDVFFFTSAQLSVTDEDQETDVYDARVDGVPATLTPHAECLGEACQPPYSPPNDPTPASSSFKGAGNVREEAKARPCPQGKRKVKRRGKVRCVKPHHHRRAHR